MVTRPNQGFRESGPHRAALARGAENIADGAKFLPRDAMHKRRAVSAMVSVTFVYYVETAKDSCCGMRKGNREQAFEWYHFQWSWVTPNPYQGAYKSGKMKFPEFSMFSSLLNSLFQTIIKWKPDVTNHRSSQFGSFLAELQNILLDEHGDWLHPSHSLCHPTNLRYCY